MFFLFNLILLFYSCGTTQAEDELPTNITVNEIIDNLLKLIKTEKDNERIKELKNKLKTINQYVINNDLIAQALTNTTNNTELNTTNFFKSLDEDDPLQSYLRTDPKSLYLKLKERMTRDDVITILAEKAKEKELKKSARRMMNSKDYRKLNDDNFSEAVDKFLADLPHDNHKFDVEDNIYWDPQAELDDLNTHRDTLSSGRRIFKGERTTLEQYPFMASIHVMGRFWCGGAIYWHDIVLTSASCLQLMHNNRYFRENPRALQVRVGSNHSRVGGELLDVLEVYFHPGYNSRTLRDNLAVIRLRHHLVLRHRKHPKLIQIEKSDNALPSTADVHVLGWGVTQFSQKMSFEPVFLQKKVLPVYPNKFCKDVYEKKFISDRMFCAGTLTTGEGACDHDAGGPAILSGKLVGIISFGPTVCGYPGAPTVFTMVRAYADWIEDIKNKIPSYHVHHGRTTTTTKIDLDYYFSTWKLSSFTTDKVYVSPFPVRIGRKGPQDAVEDLRQKLKGRVKSNILEP